MLTTHQPRARSGPGILPAWPSSGGAAAREALAAAPSANQGSLVVGGTATNLLRLVRPSRDRTINRKRLAEAMFFLLSEPVDGVAARFGLRLERAIVLPVGATIVAALCERYGLERILFSDAGIREGAILATVHPGATWPEHLTWLAHGWSRGVPPPEPVAARGPASEPGEHPPEAPPEQDARD